MTIDSTDSVLPQLHWGLQILDAAQQLGGALGVAAVGTIFFSELDRHSFLAALERSSLLVIGLVLAAAMLALALPPAALAEEEVVEALR